MCTCGRCYPWPRLTDVRLWTVLHLHRWPRLTDALLWTVLPMASSHRCAPVVSATPTPMALSNRCVPVDGAITPVASSNRCVPLFEQTLRCVLGRLICTTASKSSKFFPKKVLKDYHKPFACSKS